MALQHSRIPGFANVNISRLEVPVTEDPNLDTKLLRISTTKIRP